MKRCLSFLTLVGCAVFAGSANGQSESKHMTHVKQANDPTVQYLLPGTPLAPRGEPQTLCTLSENDNCQVMEWVDGDRVTGTSLGSMGVGSAVSLNRVADHFRTGGAGGTVTSVCWWGTYGTACGAEPLPANDHFFVTIYARGVDGAPAAVIATFEQGVSMNVSRRDICGALSRSTTEYSATLTGGVTVDPDTCYFIEIRNPVNAITNPGTASWFWSHTAPATDGSCFNDIGSNGYDPVQDIVSANSDRAFCVGITLDVFGTQACLGPPPPPICENDTANGQARDPGVNNGGFSASPSANAVGLQLAEGIQFANTVTLNSVCFWGFWVAQDNTQPTGPAQPIFDLTFFANNNNQPGTIIAQYQVGTGGTAVFRQGTNYRLEFPDTILAAGTCYFFSVSIRTEFADPNFNLRWVWGLTSAGPNGNGRVQSRVAGGAAPGAWADQNFGNAAIANIYYLFNDGPSIPTNCPLQTGACCINGVCSVVTSQASCTAQGGVFQGLGTTCNACVCQPIPGNDNCANAVTITGTGAFPFDNCNATSDGTDTCDATSGRDVWFRWRAPCDGDFVFAGCDNGATATADLVFSVFDACGGTQVGCDDDGCVAGGPSRVTFSATNGTVYTLRIASFGGGAGESARFSMSRVGGDCPVGNPCPCNWNMDGALNSQDFFDFLTAFFASNADINMDGFTNSQDFFDFLTCLFAPPAGCP